MAENALAELAEKDGKAPHAYRTISEVAAILDVPQHVLRFWESKFPQIKPLKRQGGRRYYRPADLEVLSHIRTLLYTEGYTIRGAKRALKQGMVPLEPETKKVETSPVAPDLVSDPVPSTSAPAPSPSPVSTDPSVKTPMLFSSSSVPDQVRADLQALLNELQAIRDSLHTALTKA